MKRIVGTLSGGLVEISEGDVEVGLIHRSVKEFLIKDGFRILDPEQNTHQKVMANGHSLLLTSYLWWLTEADLSGIAQHCMNTFDPAIISIVRVIDLSRDHFGPLYELDVDRQDDVRATVDALSTPDREVMRGVLSGLAGICTFWSAHYRENIISEHFESWNLEDEVFACILLKMHLILYQPSFAVYICAMKYWINHALKLAENDGLMTAITEIRKFCSRLKHQNAMVYNIILGVLHVAAGISKSWVLEELLVHVPNSPLDVNSLGGEYGATPLMEAIRKGRVENARILLSHEEIAVNALNVDAWTALFSAVDADSYEFVERHIKQVASLDIQDVEGETVLMWAVDHDRYEIITLLLEKGASIHLGSLSNVSAIDTATDRCLDGLASFIIGKIKRQQREIWGYR